MGCWSSHQEHRTATANQKCRNSFLRPHIPALMAFSSWARILGLLFSAFSSATKVVEEQGKGTKQRTIQELPTIHREKSFLPQCSIQESYVWVQAPNIMFWAQNPLKETKDEKINDETSIERVDPDRKHDTAVTVSLKDYYYRTAVDIYGALQEWYSLVTKMVHSK